MKIIALFLAFLMIFLFGCAKGSSLVDFVKEGGLEAKGQVNIALESNGGKVYVSEENPDHPAATLINGVTSSEAWNQGEGWETKYEGRFARGGYLTYGEEDPRLAEDRGLNENFDPGDPNWRGIRMETGYGGSVNAALGWAIIEFPAEKMVNRATVYTIDSQEFPAEKFGVSDLLVQYWSEKVNSWLTAERLGKNKDQQGNTIQNNKSGVINLRFQPVETKKLRFVVRWTNDSNRYTRGYYTYSSGTVRIVEIEVYGYQKEDIIEEQTYSEVDMAQDPNKIAEVEIIIDNYVDAYNRQNLDMLMASISPDYSKDGETYSDLKKRMESTFAQYKLTKLELRNVKVNLTDKGATANAIFSAQYSESAGDTPIKATGDLVFELSNSTGYWKIIRIDSR